MQRKEQIGLGGLGGAIVAGALLLFVASCRSQGTSQDTYVGGEGGEIEKIGGTSGVSDSLVMLGLVSERRDDRLHVQFELHNKRGSNLAFEWSVEWFDEGGFKVAFPQHWKAVSLGGKGYETIAVTGPTPAASSWRLALRKPNTAH
jgi:uncharacterized protein YcfL